MDSKKSLKIDPNKSSKKRKPEKSPKKHGLG
jgi:hypothetical protein